MAVFADLTEYGYWRSDPPGARNVGWLGGNLEFEKMPRDEELLEAIWQYCTVSVHLMRGWHPCELCLPHSENRLERGGKWMLLGAAEIRVFSNSGEVYAAPNLIYHYMLAHEYRPPEEFIVAARTGPKPPSQEYFDRLRATGLEWSLTQIEKEKPVIFRFVKTPDGVKRIEE